MRNNFDSFSGSWLGSSSLIVSFAANGIRRARSFRGRIAKVDNLSWSLDGTQIVTPRIIDANSLLIHYGEIIETMSRKLCPESLMVYSSQRHADIKGPETQKCNLDW